MKPSTLVLLKCQGREDMQIKLASSFWVQKTHNNLIILEIELDGHNTFGLIDRNNNKNKKKTNKRSMRLAANFLDPRQKRKNVSIKIPCKRYEKSFHTKKRNLIYLIQCFLNIFYLFCECAWIVSSAYLHFIVLELFINELLTQRCR